MLRARLFKAKDCSLLNKDTASILNDIFSLNSNSSNLINLVSSETKPSISGNQDLIDLNEKPKENQIVEDENVINEENNNLFANMTVRENIQKNENHTLISKIKQLNVSPKKFYKDRSSVLDNNFFKNFLGENQNITRNCDKELIDSLLNVISVLIIKLLLVAPSFRTITNRVILANFENFVGNTLENTHLDMLNKIFYSFLSNIKLLILSNKYIKEAGYEIFENEWIQFKKDFDGIVNNMISRPFLLIPFNLEDVVEGKDLI